jgi:hypothetical protein
VDQSEALQKARQFADREFAAEMNSVAHDTNTKIQALKSQLAARGTVLSGTMTMEVARLNAERVSKLVTRRLELLLEGFDVYGVEITDQLAQETFDGVLKLRTEILAAIVATGVRVGTNTVTPGGSGQHYAHLLEQQISIGPAKIQNEIERHRRKRSEASTASASRIEVNAPGSTIGNLNLGSQNETINVAVQQISQTSPEPPPIWKRVVAVIVFVVGVPGILSGFYSFVPRLSITPQPPLISSNAFSAPFLVANEGWLTLHDVTAICAAKDVEYTDPSHPKKKITWEWEGGDETETGGVLSSKTALNLMPAEKVNFECGLAGFQIPGEWLTRAHILFIVKYHAPFLPFPHYRRQRFELLRDSTGQLHWSEEPHAPN